MKTIELRINGSKHRMEVEAGRTLLSVLRDELDLTAYSGFQMRAT